MLDSEGSHLLPDDLGPGEPVSGLRPLINGRFLVFRVQYLMCYESDNMVEPLGNY